jgi:hypothetical protein
MAIYRAQFTIPYFTNLPTDVVVNDWHFSWSVSNPNTGDYEELRDRLIAFYDGVYSGGLGGEVMAPWCRPADASLKIYNINDPTPRAPRWEGPAALADNRVASSGIPLETAMCMSFQGDPLSGTPQARRRGRIFIGGLGAATDGGDTTSFPEPDPTLVTSTLTAAETLWALGDPLGWIWIVYSRVNGTGAVVSNGWIDNAWDTQRRRGNAPSSRAVWP